MIIDHTRKMVKLLSTVTKQAVRLKNMKAAKLD